VAVKAGPLAGVSNTCRNVLNWGLLELGGAHTMSTQTMGRTNGQANQGALTVLAIGLPSRAPVLSLCRLRGRVICTNVVRILCCP